MPCGKRFVSDCTHSGNLKVHEFLDAVNFIRRMGSWIEDDKKYVAVFEIRRNDKVFLFEQCRITRTYYMCQV